MRQLRIVTWVAAVAALAAVGCDNGGGDDDAGTRHDSGMTMTDGGHHTDSGSMHDSGTRQDGGGSASCGPTGGECDISDPSSCGTGMACLLNGDGAGGVTTQCFAAGTGTDGTTCDPNTAGQCAEGFGCGDEGVCRRWCCSDADCNSPTPTGQLCNIFGGVGPEGHEVGQCVQPVECDLVAQTGCPVGKACNLFSAGTRICDTPQDAAPGAECMFRNACGAGYACVGPAGEPGHCRQYCDMTAATPCPDGFTCDPLGGAPANIGICNPPAT